MSQIERNIIEKLVYAQATAKYLSELENESDWYKTYEYLVKCVEEGKKPDLIVWQPFEYWDWENIVENINNEAESMLYLLEQVLEFAKKGLIKFVADNTFPTDINQLCLKDMVELGAS